MNACDMIGSENVPGLELLTKSLSLTVTGATVAALARAGFYVLEMQADRFRVCLKYSNCLSENRWAAACAASSRSSFVLLRDFSRASTGVVSFARG